MSVEASEIKRAAEALAKARRKAEHETNNAARQRERIALFAQYWARVLLGAATQPGSLIEAKQTMDMAAQQIGRAARAEEAAAKARAAVAAAEAKASPHLDWAEEEQRVRGMVLAARLSP